LCWLFGRPLGAGTVLARLALGIPLGTLLSLLAIRSVLVVAYGRYVRRHANTKTPFSTSPVPCVWPDRYVRA